MPCLKKIINENEVEIQNKLEKIKASWTSRTSGNTVNVKKTKLRSTEIATIVTPIV